jgi:hypothetical protein
MKDEGRGRQTKPAGLLLISGKARSKMMSTATERMGRLAAMAAFAAYMVLDKQAQGYIHCPHGSYSHNIASRLVCSASSGSRSHGRSLCDIFNHLPAQL